MQIRGRTVSCALVALLALTASACSESPRSSPDGSLDSAPSDGPGGDSSRVDGSSDAPGSDGPKTPPAGIYVALDGDDITGDGSYAKPFRSLERGRDEARSQRAAGKAPSGGLVVWLRRGVYERDKTFVLDAQDNGSKQSPLIFRAYPNEEVSVIGGVALDTAKLQTLATSDANYSRVKASVRSKVRVLDLSQYTTDYGVLENLSSPEVVRPPALVFDYERQDLARWPNRYKGKVVDNHLFDPSILIEDADCEHDQHQGQCTPKIDWFGYGQQSAPASWKRPKEIWLFARPYWQWNHWYFNLDRVDAAAKRFYFSAASRKQTHAGEPNYFGIRKQHPYFAFNILEELDVEGEWYLDRQSGRLYYYPPANVSAGKLWFSVLDKPLVKIDGAKHIRFEDLNLGLSRNDVVVVDSGENVAFVGGRVFAGARRGAWIHRGKKVGLDNVIISGSARRCVDFSAEQADRIALTPTENYITNSDLHDCTVHGIHIAKNVVGLNISHNEIHHMPSEAIRHSGNNHTFAYNDVHRVVSDICDQGAFYVGHHWTSRGHKLHHNFLHDIDSSVCNSQNYTFAGAFYYDVTTGGDEIYGNVFHNIIDGFGVFHAGGRHLKMTNNIFVKVREAYIYLDRITGILSTSNPEVHNHVLCDLYFNDYYASAAAWKTSYPELAQIPVPECCPHAPPAGQTCPDAVPNDDQIWLSNNYNRPVGSALYDNVFFDNGRDFSPHIYIGSYAAAMKYIAAAPNCGAPSCGLNCYQDPNNQWRGTCDPGQNMVGTDPLFVDLPGGDLSLKTSSPVFSKLAGFKAIPFHKIGRNR